MKLSILADCPQFIEPLASLLTEHWRAILPRETIESRAVKLRTHLNRDRLPIAWVAHSHAKVLGTAALRVHDLEGYEHLTPWLGGVYVAPQFRGVGVGTALCAAVEQHAKMAFGISTLYLFTLDRQVWYRNRGWATFEPCAWQGRAGDMMFKRI